MLQRGRARAGAETTLLLLILAQVRNSSVATACAILSVCMLMMSGGFVIVCLF